MGNFIAIDCGIDLVVKYCGDALCCGVYFTSQYQFLSLVNCFLILTPWILPKVWQQRELIRPHLKQLAVLSAFGLVLYQGLSYTAANYTTATNMGIINAFIPMFTILVSLLILKEIPTRFAVLGCIISFSGLLYVIAQGDLRQLSQLTGHAGDMLMVLAVFFYAFYGVFLKNGI